jgi:hypothetical protein
MEILASVKSTLEPPCSDTGDHPPSLSSTIAILDSGLRLVETASSLYVASKARPDHRLARPLVDLIGYVTSALYLAEHAVWSNKVIHEHRDTDIEVLRRWVCASEFSAAAKDVEGLVNSSEKDRAAERNAERVLLFGSTKL